jgi:hypothetical protein
MGAIHEVADGDTRVKAIADEYYRSAYAGEKQSPKEVLVIAPTHAEGDAVTHEIRQKLKEKNVIGHAEHGFTVLKNIQLTEAEKLLPENYTAGNVVVFYQNSKGIKAGKRLEVTGTDGQTLMARDAEGLSYDVPMREGKKYSVFEPRHIQVTEGDKLRITANGKSNEGKNLFNGSTFSIEGFDQHGNISLSNGSTLPSDFGHFNLGYVSTSHSSQGKTAEKVIISQSSATFRASSMEQFYVSVSRGKQAVSIYTDDKEHLQQAISQSAQRTSATELMAQRQEQQQEINRISVFRKWQAKAMETYDHFTSKMRNDGLQAATRTE